MLLCTMYSQEIAGLLGDHHELSMELLHKLQATLVTTTSYTLTCIPARSYCTSRRRRATHCALRKSLLSPCSSTTHYVLAVH